MSLPPHHDALRDAARVLRRGATARGPLLSPGRRERGGVPHSLRAWIGFYAIVAAHEVQGRYAACAAAHGISLRDFVVLAEVAQRNGIGQSALAERLGLSRSRVSEQLAVLDMAGYVYREMNGADLRRRRVWIGAEGRIALEAVGEEIAVQDRAWLSPLSKHERLALKTMLRRMAPNVRESDPRERVTSTGTP